MSGGWFALGSSGAAEAAARRAAPARRLNINYAPPAHLTRRQLRAAGQRRVNRCLRRSRHGLAQGPSWKSGESERPLASK